MRRAELIWHFDGTTLTDVTDTLGDSSGTIPLQANEILYVGHNDWLSGLYVQIDAAPAGDPDVIVEMFDGQSATWKHLPVQEKVTQLQIGHSIIPRGYDFKTPGVVYWGTAQWMWTLKTIGGNFPENVTPPSDGAFYWIRLRNQGAVTVDLHRILPILYNTYASHQDVAHFLGLPEFSEINDPLQTFIRQRIRQAEDWVDNYTRKTWKLGAAYNERYVFNPYGVRLKNYPVLFVSRIGVWAGNSFSDMNEGRNKDFYVSNDTGMVYFTRILYGRGLPWSSVATRYLRAPDSLEVDYVFGLDFDTDRRRDVVSDIVIKRVATHIVNSQDWVAILTNNLDVVPKADKAAKWMEEQELEAAELRGMLVA